MSEIKLVYKMFFFEDDFFDFFVYNNYMVKVLIKEIYVNLRDKVIKNGFILDDVIQIGVDNLGKLKNCISFFFEKFYYFQFFGYKVMQFFE